MKFLRPMILLLLLLYCAGGNAQNSILWEISGNGITSPSYLMGTLKFIGKKEFTIPEEVKVDLAKCKIFAIEDEVDHHAQHELNKAVHFEDGKSLKSEVSADDYNTVQAFFQKEFKISSSKFESHYAKLIPLALSITMTRLSLGEEVSYYDIELLKLAKKNNLKTYSLEPIEREAEALQKFPIREQVKALLNSVANFEKQKEEFKMMTQKYPFEDLKVIFEYTLHPIDNNPIFIEEFYTKRNLEWLPKIEKMVKEKPAFLALGVSHLEGDNGILNLLRSKGYNLKPISLNP